jgi:hypothetical protein
LLIGTWRTTLENSDTTRVEWDAVGQLIRKVSERLSYVKGESGEASLQSIERFSDQTICDSFSDEKFLCYILPETVIDFLKLVELCKVLKVDP